MTDEVVEQEGVDAEVEVTLGQQWEFVNTIPTPDQVVELLKTLPPVWGIEQWKYADYVVGLPSTKKVKGRDDGGRKTEAYVDVVTLYMGVAGRLKMLNDAAELNQWSVSFVPEPTTPTGAPGYLQMDERIVYREYLVIDAAVGWGGNGENVQLGRKPGTAWVPKTGGNQAAGSNPYEKVETAARGRAIAAWGFGILPGSGIASLEEMQSVLSNQRVAAQGGRQQQEVGQRKSRGELMQELLTLKEEVRQERGITDDEMTTKLAEYVQKSFGVDIAEEGYTADDGSSVVASIDLSKLKDGQLGLTVNELRDTLRKIRSDSAAV